MLDNSVLDNSSGDLISSELGAGTENRGGVEGGGRGEESQKCPVYIIDLTWNDTYTHAINEDNFLIAHCMYTYMYIKQLDRGHYKTTRATFSFQK